VQETGCGAAAQKQLTRAQPTGRGESWEFLPAQEGTTGQTAAVELGLVDDLQMVALIGQDLATRKQQLHQVQHRSGNSSAGTSAADNTPS
jgi:metal-dependent amidase/aminoacylase/carboxypeptidase family protein